MTAAPTPLDITILPIEFDATLGFKKPNLSFATPPKILIGVDLLGTAKLQAFTNKESEAILERFESKS